jgi:hypothetical protein
MIEIDNKLLFNNNDIIILKPDTGCMGEDIKIMKYKKLKIMHFDDSYLNYTISKFYLSKIYKKNNKKVVVSNRLYFLVVKINNAVKSYLYDEFVNYCSLENLEENKNDYDINNYKRRLLTNYCPNEYTDELFYKNRFVSHKNFVKLFTKKEYIKIFDKIKEYLKTITREISKHILCSNDTYDDTEKEDKGAYHLYGLDVIIDDKNNVKIVEINGAPAISNKFKKYNGTECMNYDCMINELLKVTIDKIIKPHKNVEYDNNKYGYYKYSILKEKLYTRTFIPIEEITISYPNNIFYISKQVSLKYPFILNGFMNERRAFFYKRIKNPYYKKIDVFYGLRDLYKNKFSSDDYYDEIVEFNNCICSRNSKILNKIQGVTYYLANKERLYNKLISKYDESELLFHPKTIIINSINNDLCSLLMTNNINKLQKFIDNTDKLIIIKPSNGSQGKGIEIIKSDNVYSIISKFNDIKSKFNYDSFIISEYIDNSYLYKINNCEHGHKINIRFYVLLFIDNGTLKYYLLNKQIIYCSMLEYNCNDYLNIEPHDILKMRSITNLQTISYINTKYNLNFEIKDFVKNIDDLNFDNNLLTSIYEQFNNICHKTINSTKNEFRSLNRFIKDNKSFNLTAYDILLDTDSKLHLIEINRGADLVGLNSVLGDEVFTEIFEELFDLVVDGKITNFKYFSQL